MLAGAMTPEALLSLRDAITAAGLAGGTELALVQAFCAQACGAGLPLSRAVIGLDTLHPIHESRAVYWSRNAAQPKLSELSRQDYADAPDKWLRSPFHHLLQTGETSLRRRLEIRANDESFPILDELRAEGQTDYVAMLNRFDAKHAIGEADGVFSSWCTDRRGGFADAEVAALEALVPSLALAVKSAATVNIARTLMETYLGRDAGDRVLRGSIERGIAERIHAVLWFSDLQGFTRITDTAPPEQIIPLLNDYADALATAIHGQGGEVLKFIGDGILAVFKNGDGAETCRQALAAARDARARVTALNARRAAAQLPVSRFYLGLHVGEVFYGNIGAVDRLDFTVVGPAVNETSRIATMCRSFDQDILLSSAFAALSADCRKQLVSVGRYALRGVARPQELYTLDPDSN